MGEGAGGRQTKKKRNLAKLARGIRGVGTFMWLVGMLIAIRISRACPHPCSAIDACQEIATTRLGYKINQERELCTCDGVMTGSHSVFFFVFFFGKTASRFIPLPYYSPHRPSPLRQFLPLS